MTKKIHWHLMTWQEIRDARERNPVILIPAGTLETQGPNTYVGLEYVVPQRLAQAVARRTEALVVPPVPFGYSALFQDFPGTISLRPEVLTAVYEDVVTSILKHGFDHLMFLAMHVPNQPMMDHLANRIRDERGILIAWINPGRLAPDIMRETSPDYEAARGHGADPGLSLASYLEPEAGDLSQVIPNQVETEFRGFAMEGLTPTYRGFNVHMAMRLQDVSPQTGGYGDPSFASSEQGEVIFNGMVDYTVGLVEQFGQMDTHV